MQQDATYRNKRWYVNITLQFWTYGHLDKDRVVDNVQNCVSYILASFEDWSKEHIPTTRFPSVNRPEYIPQEEWYELH
jgi:hypothetical protein